jgi:hypothetical protein
MRIAAAAAALPPCTSRPSSVQDLREIHLRSANPNEPNLLEVAINEALMLIIEHLAHPMP